MRCEMHDLFTDRSLGILSLGADPADWARETAVSVVRLQQVKLSGYFVDLGKIPPKPIRSHRDVTP